MSQLLPLEFDPARCRAELDRFHDLLTSKKELSERGDLQPLLKQCPQLTAFLGATISDIGIANRIAYEFPIFGSYSADIVIGNTDRKTYCAIELEDARADSVFFKAGQKATTEWGRRLEHGFSQLVDWFFSLDDHHKSDDFARHFGYGHVEFFGMLLIGRSADISEYDRTRLRWRQGRVTINSHKLYCRTYDDLYEALNRQWELLTRVSQS